MTCKMLCRFCLIPLAILCCLCGNVHAQPTVKGKVQDSKGKPIGGVDVSIVLAGNKMPVDSKPTDPKTGEYEFSKIKISGAYDIVYSHSKYDQSVVPRLASTEDQRVCKILYLHGEKRTASALHERYQSAQRFAFLITSMPENDRAEFKKRFEEMNVWSDLEDSPGKLLTRTPDKEMMMFLEKEQDHALKLRIK